MTRTLLPLLVLLTVPLAAQDKQKETSPGAGPVKVDPQTPQAGAKSGNAWFPVRDQNLGTFFSHESAHGRFAFQNPKDAAVTWKAFSASCQCSKAIITVADPSGDGEVRRYELRNKPTPNVLLRIKTGAGGTTEEARVSQIDIGAHEAGEVEVHMEMNGITGPRQASLDIHTTDLDTPMIRLSWNAIGAQMFVVTPAEVNLNQMVWNERREFTVTVTSPVQPDFNITRMDEVTKDFTVSSSKELKDGKATWTIQGAYGPVNNEPGGGGVLKFYSDLPGEANFVVRVSAMVKGPLEVTPGTFMTLGMIRKGTVKAERVVFEPNDGTDLDAVDIQIEKLTVDKKHLAIHKSKDGNKLVVELEVTNDTPQGLLRGDLVVHLNHPVIKEKRILFNGYVR
jgi:hypothetical protein